jgi:hypothetical protein
MEVLEGFFETMSQSQERRVMKTLLIDSPSCQCTDIFLTLLQFLSRKSLHPALLYTPDLAARDFWLFPSPKIVLNGKCFLDVEDMKSCLKRFWTDISV